MTKHEARQLFLEMIQDENRFPLELFLNNLVCGDWDKERFIHEFKRYFENDSAVKKAKYIRESHTNVTSILRGRRGLAGRDFGGIA